MVRSARALALASVVFLCTVPLAAVIIIVLPQRTFVSTSGSDSSPCSRQQPCRNFDAAIAQTAAGGEVVVLDSGGYGRITSIGKSISIIAPAGVHAAITATNNADAITIDIANGKVLLRNIFITGLGGYTGINVPNVSSLTLDHLYVGGFNADGLYFAPAGNADLVIADSVFKRNGGAGADIVGAVITRSYGQVDRTRFENNGGNGLGVLAADVTVEDSVAAYNGATGFNLMTVNQFELSTVTINRCTSFHNANGIGVEKAGSLVTNVEVSDSTIFDNTTNGLFEASCCIISWGNNRLTTNAGNSTFNSTNTPQ